MLRQSAVRALTRSINVWHIHASTFAPLEQSAEGLSQIRSMSTRNRRRFSNPKLRTHNVLFMDGDYSDLDDFGDQFADDDDLETLEKDARASAMEDRRTRQQEALKAHQESEAEILRKLEKSRPMVRVPEIDDRGRSYGRGGRKTSTARVWIQPGEGLVTVNRKEFTEYFGRESDREMILSPFIATNTCGKFDVTVAVEGGGVTGKAGAIRHGIARALEKYNPDYRPPMKKLGFITRDARMVERKKIGLKKARKAPQWVRR